ncbi:uncharacterized protein LOC111831153 isoform X2 [Capsella rubella]|uniref:uncharacterized protein LOC111831153 isoform X2 n=2 Tax=Capsella rubella TaxID=81985 RepID=UPI000CD517DE|nr:uncharacterized protein LOC111831153 isoform X2 [Capsella rubella]
MLHLGSWTPVQQLICHLRQIIEKLKNEFPMSDLGKLHHFLGVKADFNKKGLFLSQHVYAQDIITRAGMVDCKPCATPVDLKSKLSATKAYAVHQICLYMHDPRIPHMNALKRIIRYLQGTKAHGLQLYRGSINTLTAYSDVNNLTAYSDADWGGCPDTRRSTSGYCVFLGQNLVSWSAKRQPTVSRSSSEAEYKGVANAVAELTWLRNLLRELHLPVVKASVVYCDNISSVYLASNPVQHQRTKHIELDIHFVREKVAIGEVKVIHVPSSLQYADIFTKGLPTSLFNEFRDSLTIRAPDASPEGG